MRIFSGHKTHVNQMVSVTIFSTLKNDAKKNSMQNFQIRKTKTVSAFPVGFVGDAFLSTPILDKNGKFVRFHDGWIADRTYPMDMAGFAVGVDHFIKVILNFKHLN